MEKFNFNPPNIFIDESSYPDPITTDESREQLSRPHHQMREFINELVDEVNREKSSDEISYKHDNLSAVTNVKQGLDEHYRLIKETQNHLNDSDENFNTHKNNNEIHVSSSEKSRWNNTYTKDETDAAISRKVVQIGAGDMAQHIYDKDGDGKVDHAELADEAKIADYAKKTSIAQTISGDFITVETAKESSGALTIHGKTYQEKYTGKNLLPKLTGGNVNTNGLTSTVSADGKIRITGTPSTNWSNVTPLNTDKISLASGKYIFSVSTNPNLKIGLKLHLNSNEHINYRISEGYVSTEVEVPEEYTSCYVHLFLEGLKANTNYDFVLDPMLRLASITDSTYEPYVGGKASPNPDYPQKVHGVVASAKRTGNNLLNLSKCEFLSCNYTDGKVVSNLGESEYYAAIRTSQLNDLLMANLGKKFTFSADKGISDRIMSVIVTGTKSDGPYYQEVSGASGSNFITMTLSNLFTSISRLDLRWNRSSVPHADRTSSITDLQFELGEKSTYKPYSESELSYNTGELFEGDVVDAFGKCTRRFKKIVLDGVSTGRKIDSIRTSNTSGKNRFAIDSFTDMNMETPSTSVANMVCSHLITVSAEDTYFNRDGIAMTTTYVVMYVESMCTYTVEQFNAWLKAQYDSGTPVTVVYELATPTEEQLTRTGDMILDKGINHIFSPEEFSPEFDLEYSPDGYPLFDWLYLKPEDIGAAPAVHNHDDRYFTENELNARLGTQCTFVLEGTTLTITTK